MNVEAVDTVGLRPQTATGTVVLGSFLAKAGAGDLASECQALFSRDAELQLASGRQGVGVQQRRVAEARRRMFEALQKYYQARRKGGFWSRLAGVFGKIFGAISSALAILGGPLGASGAVALGGALVSGGMKVASAGYHVSAARAQAQRMLAQAGADQGRSELKEWQENLEQAARFEADMVRQVRRLLDQENSTRLG